MVGRRAGRDALLKEYYTDFYGPARKEMKTFIEYGEANWMDMGQNAEKIGKAFDLLGKARQKVPADSIYAKRIALLAEYVEPMKGLREQLIKGRQDAPEARINTRDGAKITMDGKLDETAWQGTWGNSLGEIETGRVPAATTEFHMFWADDALYLGIACKDPDAKHLTIGTTRNEDGSIWLGDCVEILLETQTHSYYQLTINPAGAMTDLDRKGGLNPLWSSGAEAAAHIGEDGWSVEVRIPLAGDHQEELDPLRGVSGRKPTEMYPWFFNVCRQRVRDSGKELSAYSPTGKTSFHEVLKFGRLYAP